MAFHSYSLELPSLASFAQELETQIQGIAAPVNALAAQSGSEPKFGGFAEASSLVDDQQSALQEMYSLLGQVKQAIEFAQGVTNTVAAGYRNADQIVAADLGFQGQGGQGQG
jgi:hypothetical protein